MFHNQWDGRGKLREGCSRTVPKGDSILTAEDIRDNPDRAIYRMDEGGECTYPYMGACHAACNGR